MGEMLADKWVLVISFVLVMASLFNLAWQMIGGKRQPDNKEGLSTIEQTKGQESVPANLTTASQSGEVASKVEQVDIPASSVVEEAAVARLDDHEPSDVGKETMENTPPKPNKNFGMVSMSPNWKMVGKDEKEKAKKKNKPIPSEPSRSVDDVLRESGHAFSIDVASSPEIREEVVTSQAIPVPEIDPVDQELQNLANEVIEQEMKVLSEAVTQAMSSETGKAAYTLDVIHQNVSHVDVALTDAAIVAKPVVEAIQVAEVVAVPVVEAIQVAEVVAEPVIEAIQVAEVVAEPVIEAIQVAEVVAVPVVEAVQVAEVIAEPVVEVAQVAEVVADPVIEAIQVATTDVQLSQPLLDPALLASQSRHLAEPSVLMAGTVNAVQSIQESHIVAPTKEIEMDAVNVASLRYDANAVRLQQNVKGLSSSISDRFKKMAADGVESVPDNINEVQIAAVINEPDWADEMPLVMDVVEVAPVEAAPVVLAVAEPADIIEPEAIVVEVTKLDDEPQQSKVRRSLASYSFAK